VMQLFWTLAARMALLLAPIFLMTLIVGFLACYLQVGPLFTTRPFTEISLEKFNPITGLGRLFSKRSLVELLKSCAKVGLNFRVAAPKGFEPDDQVVTSARTIAKETGSEITLTWNAKDAAKDCHIIYSDVWVSMGQEEESRERLKIFQPYQVNAELASLAAPDHIFMHCLPAHRGLEVTAEVIDGEHSVIFDQAENRMHVQKAILAFLMRNN